MYSITGYLFVFFAAIFHGSWIIFFKFDNVKKYKPEPVVYQLYLAIGVFIFASIFQLFLSYNNFIIPNSSNEFQVSYYAMIGGMIYIISDYCSLMAIQRIGTAITTGCRCGAVIFTSTFWAVVVFQEYPIHALLFIIGIFFLILGILGVAFCTKISIFFQKIYIKYMNKKIMDSNDDIKNGKDNNDNSNEIVTDSIELLKEESDNFKIGVFWALANGITGGTMSGLIFLWSYALGGIILSPLLLLINYIQSGYKFPNFYFKEIVLYGILSGIFFAAYNLFAIGAIPRLGYGIAFPLSQCSVLVGGLWGIYYFKEIKGYAIIVFFISAIVILSGAVLLSIK